MSMPPPAMEEHSRPSTHGGNSDEVENLSAASSIADWPQIEVDPPNQHHASDSRPASKQSPPPLDVPHDAVERPSATNLRSAFSPGVANHRASVRPVTPELMETQELGASVGLDATGVPHMPRPMGSHPTSPRSVPGGANRRQGIVFSDSITDPYESGDSSPPLSTSQHRISSGTIRPRTRTLDTSMMAQRSAPPATEQRIRVGSMSSTGSQPAVEDPRQTQSAMEPVGYPSLQPGRAAHESASATMVVREGKKAPSRRLMKRHSSRPNSPSLSLAPSLDSLPFPVSTSDPHKIVLLMRTLCGKMRGEIEYQGESRGPWYPGVAYIDEEKACLMFDSGQHGPFHIPLVSDLRGCRILPVDYPDAGKQGIEIVSAQPMVEIILCPLVPDELDLWLAALLCWQQVRPMGIKVGNGGSVSPAAPVRPELKRHGTSDGSKPTNIIKVGKVRLWDKGFPMSARSIMKRSSTRDPRSSLMIWRRMSCILQDNGNFKLLTENDSSVVSIIEVAQLSRCGIQQLDRTVLDEEYCIAVFPIYASTSTSLSIFRPVYLAFDNRVQFEVWFALLRELAVPDVYRLDDPAKEQVQDMPNLEEEHEGEVFRLERTIAVRVTEAKIKANPLSIDVSPTENRGRAEADVGVGNYLAEVVLDGEVRARTITKAATKNPFWREDCEFSDLPPTLPFLCIVLKRVEGNLEALTAQLQLSQAQGKPAQLQEVTWGTMEISLEQLERGKDNEDWVQILDEQQQSIGSMLLKVSHEEHVVLLQKEYQGLSDLLHHFANGLTIRISGLMSNQLRRLAEIFLNIFQVSGSASDWLMSLVEDEIDGIGSQATINRKYRFSSRLKSNESAESSSDRELVLRDMSKSLAGEANLLFRGNSLLTQALEFHMRRLGKEYLQETLQERIFELNELNPDCEVDPSKLQHTGGDLEQHWNRLIALTTEVWMVIAESASRIPPELRHILKYIRAVAEDRYGDFLRTVKYTSVSGFLFLRFICPAILSPKLFGLLRDHPRTRAQRTLTFVAKALQKMANLSTFGKREEWMEPMNRFLNAQRPVFRDFIDSVCSIPADQGPKIPLASYSTPLTILGRLGPTAREGFPSLPYLIDQPRNFAGLVKIWTDANPIDKKKVQPEPTLATFHEICVTLQRRADACHGKVEGYDTTDSSYGISDELAETLEQASLIESLNFSYNSPAPSTWAGVTDKESRAPGSSGSDAAADEATSNRRRSREVRRGRELGEARKLLSGGGGGGIISGGLRQVSGASSSGGTLKARNGKVGRTILSGIMKISGRGESPDGKGHK